MRKTPAMMTQDGNTTTPQETPRRTRRMSVRRQIVSNLRSAGADPLVVMTTARRLLLEEHHTEIQRLKEELRVLECFGPIRATWKLKSCRHKIRMVLGCGVAMSPVELSRLLGEKINSIRSTLGRMLGRGEVRHAQHGRWICPTMSEPAATCP